MMQENRNAPPANRFKNWSSEDVATLIHLEKEISSLKAARLATPVGGFFALLSVPLGELGFFLFGLLCVVFAIFDQKRIQWAENKIAEIGRKYFKGRE